MPVPAAAPPPFPPPREAPRQANYQHARAAALHPRHAEAWGKATAKGLVAANAAVQFPQPPVSTHTGAKADAERTSEKYPEGAPTLCASHKYPAATNERRALTQQRQAVTRAFFTSNPHVVTARVFPPVQAMPLRATVHVAAVQPTWTRGALLDQNAFAHKGNARIVEPDLRRKPDASPDADWVFVPKVPLHPTNTAAAA